MKLIKSFVPHSRCFGSYFDVIFVMYLVSSGFSFKPTSSCSSSSSSTQFSQEWARRKVVVKHSIKSKLNHGKPKLKDGISHHGCIIHSALFLYISDFCKNEVFYPIISSIQYHLNIKTTSSLSLKHDCAQDKRSNIAWKFHQFRLSVVYWRWYIVQYTTASSDDLNATGWITCPW